MFLNNKGKYIYILAIKENLHKQRMLIIGVETIILIKTPRLTHNFLKYRYAAEYHIKGLFYQRLIG